MLGFSWLHGGFHKWGYPQIIHFSGIFPCKPTILGIPKFRKPPHQLYPKYDVLEEPRCLTLGTSVSQQLVKGVRTQILPTSVNIPQSIGPSGCRGNAMMVLTLFASPTTMHFMVLAGRSAGWSHWNLDELGPFCLPQVSVKSQPSGRLPKSLSGHTSCPSHILRVHTTLSQL